MAELAHPQCQFSGESCSTESTHYRKVISHIFGRNKKCTVNVPDSVWIYYCRKHYQRARYRTAEWPFRQCDLAIDTIRNMQAWGGVESFDLVLRRRETKRGWGEAENNGPDKDTHAESSAFASSPDAEEDQSVDQGASSPGGISSSSFVAINQSSATASTANEDGVESDGNDVPALGNINPVTPAATTAPSNGSSNNHAAASKKRSPKSIPRPVPEWLYDCVGKKKTFAEVLQVLSDLRDHLLQIVASKGDPHFPDIEILPNLRRQPPPKPHSQTKKSIASRVSARGSITKPDLS
ncbi:hypothetical protein FQN57_001546 [Myotisia sp. PD_48]|nr:hypothetical protein FQN57_001546 [Myotisia sp. PD_48]